MRPKMFLVAVIISLIVAAPVTIALSKQNTKLQIEKANNHQLQLKIESDSKTLESKDQELKKKEQENTDLSQKLEAKAEAKAKLAAAQAATPSFPPGGVAQASAEPTPASAAPAGGCEEWMIAAQVVDITNARILIARESGCNPNAFNASSGACGIPQALPCSKLGGTKDPVEQIKWMQSYVFGRYGSWANALSHSYKTGWY